LNMRASPSRFLQVEREEHEEQESAQAGSADCW
jgi:hypothetical protein